MRTTNVLLAALALAGCASTHAEPEPTLERIDGIEASAIAPSAPIPIGCFEAGRALVEVASIDNDDRAEHGPMLTFGVAPDRRIAVAAEDGTVKLWTLEGFVGELDPSVFLYGAESARAQVLDLAFWDEQIVLADVSGLVSAWTTDAGFRVLGGVDPDLRVEAVAMDLPRLRMAHADEREGGHVMVRGLEDATTFGPLETALTTVTDLAFLADGRLVIAGGGPSASLEIRDATDPTVVAATAEGVGAVREIAVDGAHIVAAHEGAIVAFDTSLVPAWEATLDGHAPVSVAIAGDVVYTVGAEGALAAWSLVDGRAVTRVDVPDPVKVRVDPVAGLVIVGSRDGTLRAFDCAD